MRSSTLDRQIDGDHYKKMGLQPWEIIEKNRLDYFHGAVLKYLLRWQDKDGVIDLDKIIHYVEHIKALALSGHYGDKFLSLASKLNSKTARDLYESIAEEHDSCMYESIFDVTPNKASKVPVKRTRKPVVKRSTKKGKV